MHGSEETVAFRLWPPVAIGGPCSSADWPRCSGVTRSTSAGGGFRQLALVLFFAGCSRQATPSHLAEVAPGRPVLLRKHRLEAWPDLVQVEGGHSANGGGPGLAERDVHRRVGVAKRPATEWRSAAAGIPRRGNTRRAVPVPLASSLCHGNAAVAGDQHFSITYGRFACPSGRRLARR